MAAQHAHARAAHAAKAADAAHASGAAPYSVRLDPDAARSAAEAGATVLMLGVPPGSIVGVDHQAFATGQMFKGVKMLPAGPHFVSCAAAPAGMGGTPAPPTGFFLHLSPRQVVVKVWDPATEMLTDMADSDDAARHAAGARAFDFDTHLAPYDIASHAAWEPLVRHVTAPLIDALVPVGGAISIAAEAEDPDLLHPKTPAEARLVEQLRRRGERGALAAVEGEQQGRQPRSSSSIHSMEHDAGAGASAAAANERDVAGAAPTASSGPASSSAPGCDASMPAQASGRRGGRCFYTRVPLLVKQRGLSAAELTAANMDKSSALLAATSGRYGSDIVPLLGELQFAFVAFVYGQSLDGFAQWKALLVALLGCEDAALRSHPCVFVQLLAALQAQLRAALGPEDGGGGNGAAGGQAAPFGVPMVEELLPDSFLRRMFGRFFSMLQESPSEVSSDLEREATALKQLLRSRLGWEYDFQLLDDLDDGDDEDMPVVVDPDEQYVL